MAVVRQHCQATQPRHLRHTGYEGGRVATPSATLTRRRIIRHAPGHCGTALGCIAPRTRPVSRCRFRAGIAPILGNGAMHAANFQLFASPVLVRLWTQGSESRETGVVESRPAESWNLGSHGGSSATLGCMHCCALCASWVTSDVISWPMVVGCTVCRRQPCRPLPPSPVVEGGVGARPGRPGSDP